jgi:hypothetical protein
MQQYVVDHLNAYAKVGIAYAAVLDKPGQVFEAAIYGLGLSESGSYGSRVRGIRTIGTLESHQEVIALIKRGKLLILREMVGAKGFEPSTSWSRNSISKTLKAFPGVAYGL